MLHGEFGKAATRRQIECVKLVDLRWHDQQRFAPHFVGGGRILNQLKNFAAKHDGAWRDGEILADLKLALVDHARHAAVIHQVVEQVLRAVQQALALGLRGALNAARIT